MRAALRESAGRAARQQEPKMSSASDARSPVDAKVVSKPRNSHRAGAVMDFAVIAFVWALLALFATGGARNSPASAPSGPDILYGP